MFIEISQLVAILLVVASVGFGIGTCAVLANNMPVLGTTLFLITFSLLLTIGTIGGNSGSGLMLGFALIFGFFWIIFVCCSADTSESSSSSYAHR